MENGNAVRIKNWATETVSQSGWTLVSMRAFPELLLCKRKVSLLNIGGKSKLDLEHVEILNKYFIEVYGIEIPKSVSDFEPKQRGSSGFNIDWVDRVTGRMKVSLTIIKPAKWFDDLFKK